jgi:hypothetical protein
MEFLPLFFSSSEISLQTLRRSCGTLSTSRGRRAPLAGRGEYPGGRGEYPPGGLGLLAQEVPYLHHLHVLRLVQTEEFVDCQASLEVVLDWNSLGDLKTPPTR